MTAYTILGIILFSCLLHILTSAVIQRTPEYDANDKYIPLYHSLVAVTASSMLFVFGWSLPFFKGILLSLIMLYAAVSDIKTHRVSDCVCVAVFLTGFIGVNLEELPIKLSAGLMIGSLMLLCAILTKNRLGGADVKITATSVFLLGMFRGMSGLFIGILLSLVVNLLMKNRKKAFPLVPYLAIGFTAAYFFLGENRT